ncbi:MAG: protein translocase subunit SecD [Neomegalonema sp.]|nr:protein translocase subunit SecD [Neomegalonema sp.]
MLHFALWKKVLMALVVFIGVLAALPNLLGPSARDSLPGFLPSQTVNLGLDLQGGSHFLLEAQVGDSYASFYEGLWPQVRDAIRELDRQTNKGVGSIRRRSMDENGLVIWTQKPETVAQVGEALRALGTPVGNLLTGGGQSNIVVEQGEEAQTWRITLSDAAKEEMNRNTLEAVIEVIRRRVDAIGTREPTIQRQGTDRVLVQLPGEQSVNVEDLLKGAKLEFQMVAEDVGPADIAAGRIPPGVEVLPYDAELNPEDAGRTIAVYEKVDLTGENLSDAQLGFDPDNGLPVVNLRFDGTGARIFGQITRANVNRRFAMVLDRKVLSAPVIRQAILGGSAQISGNFNSESATALAVNLRSGALPVDVTIEESSVVGPELGADSVAAGRLACIIGFIGVMVYVALTYGWFGMIANLALIINVVLIFGALSMLGATLTLPGIAGIVLTIGMAVDANVLVFERIREELRGGRSVARAIEIGYERAFTAIIDANVTTFLAAAILFAMGSGPVRGFSVTLGIGIITSVFTAVMLTRFFVASWYAYKRPKELLL